RPVMRKTEEYDSDKKCLLWAKDAAKKVKAALNELLDLNAKEKKFLKAHKEGKKLDFSLITDDEALIKRLDSHPKILWVQQKRNQPSRGRSI
ncbi:MAG TPA: hypothetical protein PLV25_02325, partial [Opitutales bacterium]|nr:hypothetical protein [Opitutales bacterium]